MFDQLWNKIKPPTKDMRIIGSWAFNKLRPPTKDVAKIGRALPWTKSPFDAYKKMSYEPAKKTGSWALNKLKPVVPRIGETIGKGTTRLAFGDVKNKGVKEIPKHIWDFEKEIARIPGRISFQFGKTGARLAVGEKAEDTGDVYGYDKIKSYNQKIEDKYLESRRQGMSDKMASAVSILGVGGEMILDATILSGFIRTGMKAISKNIKVPLKSQTAAWEELGRAKTLKEAKKIQIELHKEYSPLSANAVRKGTVNEEIAKEVNNAYKILEKSGIPKKPARISVDFKKTVDILEKKRKLSTFKSSDILREFRTTEQPYLGIKGLLPEQAGTMPTRPFQARKQPMGLSIRDIEAKPIKPSDKLLDIMRRPKEIDLLKKEASKYETVEKWIVGRIKKQLPETEPEFGFSAIKNYYAKLETQNLDIQAKRAGYEGIADFFNKATKAVKPITKAIPKIPKELDPLIAEARKYKSAEEFFLNSKQGRELLRKKGIKSQEAIKNWWDSKITPKEPVLDNLNPTGSLYVDYTPSKRATIKLGDNITTLDKTSGKSPNETITIYRGAPKNQKEIVPGDFVTTNYDLAKSYTDEENVLSKKVKMSDVLDDITEPLGEEYIYRPTKPKKTLPKKKSVVETPKLLTTPEIAGKGFVMKPVEKKVFAPTTRIKRETAKSIKDIAEKKVATEALKTAKKSLSGFDNFIDITKVKKKAISYKEMNIAENIVGDKTSPAIRKSGFYADKEIQFASVSDIYSQKLSPHLMALKQDGYKLGGKFGTVFSKIWKPTEKAIRAEKEFASKNVKTILDLGKKYKIKATKKNLEYMSDVVEKKVKGTPAEELYVKELREVLDRLREEVNVVREAMGKNKMGYIENYIPHIQKANIWSELLSNKATISDNLDFIIPNQTKNPFAFKRMLEEMATKPERNLYTLLDRYVGVIGKDIYYTPAIENIKAYNGVLKSREKIKAAQYWDEYIRTGLIGKQHKIDSALGIGMKTQKGLKKWNDIVNKAFLTGKVAWNIATQPLSYIMNVPMETGFKNSLKGIYKGFRKPLRQYVKENSNVLNIKNSDVHAIAVGEGRNIQNRIYKTKIDKYNDFISMIGSIEERELTMSSYIAGLEKAKGLGYKGDDALWFADLTAARTQSMYNRENRALILNSDITRTIFPFQSFSIEMFNHIKEIGGSGAFKMIVRQRAGKLFGLIIGMYLANKYSEAITGKSKTTIGTFVPFLGGTVVDPMIAKIKGEQYYGGRSPITVIQIGEDIIKGSQDYIKYGSTKRLRKVGVNFGLALKGIGGGGQINNLIDGIMANIDEDVKNVSGDVMFEVKDLESKIKAPIFGVWATKEGIEYWKPKEKTPYEKAVAEDKKKDKKARERIKPIYDKIQKMKKTNPDNCKEYAESFNLSKEDKEIYKKIKTSEKRKETNRMKEKLYPIYLKIEELKKTNPDTVREYAESLNLSDEEKRVYQLLKAQLAEKVYNDSFGKSAEIDKHKQNKFFHSALKDDLPQQEMTRREFLRLPENPTTKQIAIAIERIGERNEVFKKAEPKYSINSIVDFIRDKIPFLRDTKSIGAERALKKEVMNAYNYTDEAKKMIEKIKIKDTSPVIDPILGIAKEGKGIKTYGGRYHPADIKYPEVMGQYKKITVKKGRIESANLEVNTTAHELLHHFWEKSNRKGFDVAHLYEGFPDKWEAYLANYKKEVKKALKEGKDETEFVDRVAEEMLSIDSLLDNNSLYKNLDYYDYNNERFAHFGDRFGRGGLKNIPNEFQEFYAYFYK